MQAPIKKSTKKTVVPVGKTLRVLTPAERKADIKAFGKEIRKTKDSARAFLQRAGILDAQGELAAPYRTQ
ncbi:MAG: hypothetical protein JSS57_25455 [Proteobacteria bacterium]|nr:hypothetical protein [Pseudomonadota bacterium]